MSAHFQRAFQPLDIGCLLGRIGQEMKGCSVVPDIIGPRRLQRVASAAIHITSLPLAPRRFRTVSRAAAERSSTNHIAEPIDEKAVDQP